MLPETPPLERSYATRTALVLLALCPNIVLGAAADLLRPDLLKDLHTTRTALAVVEGVSNAGYAFGAVLAVALVKRFPPRRLLLTYAAIFLAGSIIAAVAGNAAALGAGRALQGASTGLLLVAALPPLVTSFSVKRLPTTVAVVDVGLFGAVTLGPLVGGIGGATHDWRLVQVGAAVLALAAMACVVASVPAGEPLDPDGRIDRSALYLAFGGTLLPFLATALLTSSALHAPRVLIPLAVGLVLLVALVVTQYRHDEPLTPVRLISHTIPLTGLLAAMFAGAVTVALLHLVGLYGSEVSKQAPAQAAAASWPTVLGVVVASTAFALMFRSRLVPVLVNIGMAVLVACAIGLARLSPGAPKWQLVLIGFGVGFGAGATVSPGLFQAALAVPSDQLGPAFALVELLRSAAAFLVAPLLLHLAMGSTPLIHGIAMTSWVVAGIGVMGLVVIQALPLAGGTRLQSPDLPAWLENGGAAVESPRVGDAIRSGQR